MAANKHKAMNSLQVGFVILMLISVYAITYCALLNPVIVANQAHLGMVIDGYREPDYRIGGVFARLFFWPASWIDQHTRPGYWADASDPLISTTAHYSRNSPCVIGF